MSRCVAEKDIEGERIFSKYFQGKEFDSNYSQSVLVSISGTVHFVK